MLKKLEIFLESFSPWQASMTEQCGITEQITGLFFIARPDSVRRVIAYNSDYKIDTDPLLL
jgi:hypothetical protein